MFGLKRFVFGGSASRLHKRRPAAGHKKKKKKQKRTDNSVDKGPKKIKNFKI